MSVETTSSVGFVARAKAMTLKGDIVAVEAHACVRGMTDNGQPGWTRYGGTKFDDLDELKRLVPYLVVTDSMKLVPGTVEYFRVVTTTTVTVEETAVHLDAGIDMDDGVIGQ